MGRGGKEKQRRQIEEVSMDESNESIWPVMLLLHHLGTLFCPSSSGPRSRLLTHRTLDTDTNTHTQHPHTNTHTYPHTHP